MGCWLFGFVFVIGEDDSVNERGKLADGGRMGTSRVLDMMELALVVAREDVSENGLVLAKLGNEDGDDGDEYAGGGM